MNTRPLALWMTGALLIVSLFLGYHHLGQSGVELWDNPTLAGLIPKPASLSNEATPVPVDFPPSPVGSTHNNGFTLAILVLAGMVISLFYTLGRLMYGLFKDITRAPLPAWQGWLIPILCVIGLVVAGYLSYIEISLAQAPCGPVGNCNAVQSSSYARLWGVLPIGVLGAGGYIVILAAWWASRQKWGWLSSYAGIALFGMTFCGTIFSAYLTYLEPFVIKAVCIWCITSSILITLLLLLSIRPALCNLVGDPYAEETAQ